MHSISFIHVIIGENWKIISRKGLGVVTVASAVDDNAGSLTSAIRLIWRTVNVRFNSRPFSTAFAARMGLLTCNSPIDLMQKAQ
jgi:hypothetical protein